MDTSSRRRRQGQAGGKAGRKIGRKTGRKIGRKTGASMAEFGPVLVILILITIVPLTNLLFFMAGYACVSALCQSCATDAANSATFSEALVNVRKRVLSVTGAGLGKFVKLQPVGGYEGCGIDLYIATTNLANPNIGQFFGPNSGLPAGSAANGATTMYEYNVRSKFAIGPCMDLSALPLAGSLPMVGKPVTVELSTSRAAEHIDCLTAN